MKSNPDTDKIKLKAYNILTRTKYITKCTEFPYFNTLVLLSSILVIKRDDTHKHYEVNYFMEEEGEIMVDYLHDSE